MSYRIVTTRLYERNYARLVRRQYDMSLLDAVVLKLANGETLPPKYKDHALTNNLEGYRDCHIRHDWVLIYKIDHDALVLALVATGTHSDVF